MEETFHYAVILSHTVRTLDYTPIRQFGHITQHNRIFKV